MKTSLASAILAAGTLALAGISSGQDERVGTVSPPPGGSSSLPLPPSGISNRLKQYSYEQRADFTATVRTLATQSDNTWTAMNVGYIEMEATAPRRSAMEFLRTTQIDFKDKVAALDNTTPETWETLKGNVVMAWDRYEQALLKARSVPQ
jgi:hypothetical protein